jgi:dihydropteroate synthase
MTRMSFHPKAVAELDPPALAPDTATPMSILKPHSHFDWQLRTRTLALGQRTLIMAIVNLTPDSFSGDGLLSPGMEAASAKVAVAAAIEALDNGADIIDLGAESTRPNATPISSEEEQSRLLPVLQSLLNERPDAIVSVDTYHAATARIAARMGAEIVNDVSGLAWDEEMGATVAQSGCGLVLMHTRGRPTDWATQKPVPHGEIVPYIFSDLCEAIAYAEAAGIATQRIVIDPGFGFGKRGDENFALLGQLSRLKQLGRPILAGLSRKSFLGDAVQSLHPPALTKAAARRNASVAANTAAILAGADILRVHDVQATREAAAVADCILNTLQKQAIESE